MTATNVNTSVPQSNPQGLRICADKPLAGLNGLYPAGIPLRTEFSLDGCDYREFCPEQLPSKEAIAPLLVEYLSEAPQAASVFFIQKRRILIPVEWLEVAA